MKFGAWLINSQTPQNSPVLPNYWESISQTRQRVWELDPKNFK
jgi:hypothetical protein